MSIAAQVDVVVNSPSALEVIWGLIALVLALVVLAAMGLAIRALAQRDSSNPRTEDGTGPAGPHAS